MTDALNGLDRAFNWISKDGGAASVRGYRTNGTKLNLREHRQGERCSISHIERVLDDDTLGEEEESEYYCRQVIGVTIWVPVT